jgi:hypothetical protein
MNDTQKTGPRDVFTHLLAIIFLYVGVFAFGSIIFSLIDIYFPDLLAGYGSFVREGLRLPLAILVIVFPFYVALSWYLEKDVDTHPEKRELRTRRWLLYFTLFATTIAIVIDLIVLILSFLQGELTLHFILKILTVLVIAATIFTYYLWILRKKESIRQNTGMRLFVWGAIGVVVLVIIFGFYVAGSPQSQRARRFDDQRVNDLTNIQYQVVSYWQAKQKLPQSLDDLSDPIRGFVIPQDPETKAVYEYRVIGDKSFELCATFLTNSTSDQAGITKPMFVGVSENWTHNVGRTCFSRVIDPDLYPLLKKLTN